MDEPVVDRRALPGLAAGLAGLASGIGAILLEAPALAGVAAACGLAAASISVVQTRRLGDAEREALAGVAPVGFFDIPVGRHDWAGDIVDHDTDLPGGSFFTLVLENRVAAARRHLWPVSVVLVEVGLAPECETGPARSDALAGFAEVLRDTLREADISCRSGHATFAVVLDDTGEEGAVWAAERVQVAVSHDVSKVRRMAAGVASYPTHGLEAAEVLGRAEAALARACARPAGRGLGEVEVALPDFA